LRLFKNLLLASGNLLEVNLGLDELGDIIITASSGSAGLKQMI